MSFNPIPLSFADKRARLKADQRRYSDPLVSEGRPVGTGMLLLGGVRDQVVQATVRTHDVLAAASVVDHEARFLPSRSVGGGRGGARQRDSGVVRAERPHARAAAASAPADKP